MTQFTIYKSSDTSAPRVAGTSGDLTTALKAILVNGYGSKSAAGWTNPLSGAANQEVFKQGAGSQMYLQVDDASPGAGLQREARCSGWETMSAYNTGTGQFPTAAQLATFITFRKSTATADTTARTWICFADARTFYFFVLDGTGGLGYTGFMFGDFYTTASGDTWNCAIMGRSVEINGALTSTNDNFASITAVGSQYNSLPGHYIVRPYTGVGGTPAPAGKTADGSSGSNTSFGVPGTALTYPNTADGGLYIAPVRVADNSPGAAAGLIRGRLRGAYHGFHAATNFSDGDTFTGTGDYAGKTFQIVKGLASPAGNTGGYIVMETSNTLET